MINWCQFYYSNSISSTYCFHGVMYSINLGSSILSNSAINIPAITGLELATETAQRINEKALEHVGKKT